MWRWIQSLWRHREGGRDGKTEIGREQPAETPQPAAPSLAVPAPPAERVVIWYVAGVKVVRGREHPEQTARNFQARTFALREDAACWASWLAERAYAVEMFRCTVPREEMEREFAAARVGDVVRLTASAAAVFGYRPWHGPGKTIGVG